MDSKDLRIVFAGTPDFAESHLQILLESGHDVTAVYTQPDRPAGRGKKLTPSPVKALALSHGIAVEQPGSLKAPEARETLRALEPDLMVVVAYGLLLPQAILDIPRCGCINVHASLLPRWRGAAPIERAILAGDAETGVSIMQMDAGMDTGDILLSLSTPIAAGDNSATVSGRLVTLGRQGLLTALQRLAAGTLEPRAQDNAASTHAAKLGKEEARIDWRRRAIEIRRQVNAFYPRSPAFTFLGRERIRILSAGIGEAEAGAEPGTIVAADRQGLRVACGDATLRVFEVQLPGKNPVPVAALLNARREQFAAGGRFDGGDPGP